MFISIFIYFNLCPSTACRETKETESPTPAKPVLPPQVPLLGSNALQCFNDSQGNVLRHPCSRKVMLHKIQRERKLHRPVGSPQDQEICVSLINLDGAVDPADEPPAREVPDSAWDFQLVTCSRNAGSEGDGYIPVRIKKRTEIMALYPM